MIARCRWIVALALASLCAGIAAAAESVPQPLELVVLGSGGPGATGRASSSYLLIVDSVPRILIDAGSGSFVTLGKTGLSLAATDLVLLTHLHIDHVGELPGLFKARAVSSSAPLPTTAMRLLRFIGSIMRARA